MVVKTETKHREEFLLSEGNGDISRESGTLKAGESVVDGTVLENDAGALVAAGATTLAADVVGVAIGNVDASLAAAPISYVARLATVKESALTVEGGMTAAVRAGLAAAFIVPR